MFCCCCCFCHIFEYMNIRGASGKVDVFFFSYSWSLGSGWQVEIR